MISIKVHSAYRKIIAVCDVKLIGKRFEQGKLQLDIKKDFYGGEQKSEKETVELLKEAKREDATFNFIGDEAINAGIKAGIISKDGISRVKKIPHALSLL